MGPHDPQGDVALRARLKGELRKRRQQVRRALPGEAREARSAAICEALRALPEVASAHTLLAFVPMRREVQLRPVVEDAWARGATVAAPRMSEDYGDIEPRLWLPDAELEESGMGFLQPPAEASPIPAAQVDLVLVPALAVDLRGYRLGYGRGFYDRLLPRLARALRVVSVFDFELMTEIPNTPWDEAVDVVVTDHSVFRPKEEAEG